MPKATSTPATTKASTKVSVKSKSKPQPSASASTSTSTLTKQSKSKSKTQLYSSFLPIPLTLSSPIPVPIASSSKTQFKSGKEVNHYIYVRPHVKTAALSSSKSKKKARSIFNSGNNAHAAENGGDDAEEEEAQGEGRTLFAINIPADTTERDLRSVFGRWGVVESVVIGGAGRTSNEVNVLEQAVRGLPIEDDDDDEDDDEEDEEDEEDDGESGEASRQLGEGLTFQPDIPTKLTKNQRRSARRKAKNTLPASVPSVTPLSGPLDPRNGDGLGCSGMGFAHVIFLDKVSVERVMSSSVSAASAPISVKRDTSVPTGLEYYKSLYRSVRPSLASIRQFADSSMNRFDHLHSLLLSSRAKAQGAGALVDEDGFTIVVRSGKYGRAGARGDGVGKMGVGVANRGFNKGGKAVNKAGGKGSMELEGFYKFQKVDKKREELADLRAKFESDKAKVEELKKARRYKPY